MSNRNIENLSISESDNEDDDDFVEQESSMPVIEEKIDPTQLAWLPWMWYHTKQSAKKGYEMCDAAGEKLAWFFGITKPKYYSELQEYERMSEDERKAWLQAFRDVEQTDHTLDLIVTLPPRTTDIFNISNGNSTKQ